jgi:hypothetical protein
MRVTGVEGALGPGVVPTGLRDGIGMLQPVRRPAIQPRYHPTDCRSIVGGPGERGATSVAGGTSGRSFGEIECVHFLCECGSGSGGIDLEDRTAGPQAARTTCGPC